MYTSTQSLLFPLLVLTLIPAVLSDHLEREDIPSACLDICAPIITLTALCDGVEIESESEDAENRVANVVVAAQLASSEVDTKFLVDPARLTRRHDEDGDGALESGTAECVCANSSFDVAMVAAYCAGCLAQNGGIEDAGDMAVIMSQCDFSTSSYAPSITAMVADITVLATDPTITAAGETSNAGGDSEINQNAGSMLRGPLGVLSLVAAIMIIFL